MNEAPQRALVKDLNPVDVDRAMKRILLIINGPGYGADETFNAIRLASALGRWEDARGPGLPHVRCSHLRHRRSEDPETATTRSTEC